METQNKRLAKAFQEFKEACVEMVRVNNEINEKIGRPLKEITEFMEDFEHSQKKQYLKPYEMTSRQNHRRVLKQVNYESTQIKNKA